MGVDEALFSMGGGWGGNYYGGGGVDAKIF